MAPRGAGAGQPQLDHDCGGLRRRGRAFVDQDAVASLVWALAVGDSNQRDCGGHSTQQRATNQLQAQRQQSRDGSMERSTAEDTGDGG